MAELTQTKAEVAAEARPRRIFLLEDDPGNAAVIQTYIKMIEPARIDTASSIADLNKRFPEIRGGNYDVVILDIALPDGESTGFANEIRSAGIDAVAAFTGRTDDEDLQLYESSGFVHVFEKPILFSRFSAEYRDLVGLTLTDRADS